jgi:putative Holliday junction resolvase
MGRILALDVGEKRIGVAVSDETATLARPLTTITRASRRDDFGRIAQLAVEQRVECVVAGYPLSLSGAEGPQAQRVRRYVEALAQGLSVPVEMWDERYTTVAATERLRDAGTRRRRDRGQLDAAAAAVLLQDYLDARRSTLMDTEGLTKDEIRNTEYE